MKRYYGFFFILICALYCSSSFSQNYPTYSIPSYDVAVLGVANFVENFQGDNTGPSDKRRQVNVQVRTNTSNTNCSLRVWIYSLDHTTLLGPYYLATDQQLLSVDVDDREWGVIIHSLNKSSVDVWFTDEEVSTST